MIPRGLILLVLAATVPAIGGGTAPTAVPEWVRDAVFYQIFPERFANGDPSNDPPDAEAWGDSPTNRNFFGGDLAGVLRHLVHLDTLGFTAIYLNPVFVSPSNHKYNTTDYLRIDPHFGDEAVFRALVEECHRRGMRIILDGVFNHSGVDFFAFADLKAQGAASAYADWFRVHSYPVAPPSRPNYECWWGYGHMPKLMTGTPAVREYLFRVTRHWMEYGIDGWRLDVANEIPHEFWIVWRELVKSIDPDAYIVGEIWQNAEPWLRGDQFDGVMNYRFRDACVEFFARRSMSVTSFDSLLARQRADYRPEVRGTLLNLLGSHDTERFRTLCEGRNDRVRLAWLFQHTWEGAPMVYYGDEFGMEGGKDPACRGTMVWENEERDDELAGVLGSLIAMRRRHAVLRRGDVRTLLTDDAGGVYAYRRTLPDADAVVILNNSGEDRTVRLPAQQAAGPLRPVWPPGAGGLLESGREAVVRVPAVSGMVFIGEKNP